VLPLVVFVLAAAASLATSWLLVSRLERIGERLGLSEALLGILAALAADAPEITAAISALTSHEQSVGAGVVLGSNVFNLAALLGLGAVVAGQIMLFRKVVALGGSVAMLIALCCLVVVTGLLPVAVGLAIALVVLAGYLVLLGTEGQGLERLRLPGGVLTWLRSAVTEEEIELEEAIRPQRGRWPDAVLAFGALIVVVGVSVVMERSAARLGTRYGIPEIVIGGLVLAAVTSLPNAVSAVYLAGRGRGAATLSTALNSNTINVVVGLLLPGLILGLGRTAVPTELVMWWYAGLSAAVLALAYWHRGLSRRAGSLVIAAYAAFTVSVLVTGYALPGYQWTIIALSVGSALLLTAAIPAGLRRPAAVSAAETEPR